jgi:hypothetical protein
MLGWVKRVDWQFVRGVVGLVFNIAILGSIAWKSEGLRSYFSTIAIEIVFIFAVVTCGSLLYWLRQRNRGLYACLEIAFGILAGVYAVNQIYPAPDPDSLAKAMFATVGGVYIIVRGLDNWFSHIRQGSSG